jgi:hypothetical protein
MRGSVPSQLCTQSKLRIGGGLVCNMGVSSLCTPHVACQLSHPLNCWHNFLCTLAFTGLMMQRMSYGCLGVGIRARAALTTAVARK